MSLIEREDALKVICDAISLYGTGNRVESEILVSVSHLPSAERKGRWVFTRYFVWECSECGKNPTKGMGYTQSRSELFRFCPNCGTEMEVTEMTKEKIDSIRERMCGNYCKWQGMPVQRVLYDICNKCPLKEAEPRWIPATERLPEEEGLYLISHRNGKVFLDKWLGDDGWDSFISVTAWQPLPKPYKGGDAE